MKPPKFSAKGIRFGYDDRLLFDGFGFDLYSTDRLLIKGRNGIGKSTLLKILCGLLQAEINLFLDGNPVRDFRAFKHKIAYLPDDPPLYEELTGNDNIRFCACLWDLIRDREYFNRISELCEMLGLAHDLSKPVVQYSLGMKHKLFFAIMMARCPEITFLDEPFSAFDEQSRRKGIELLLHSASEGRPVVFVSHDQDLQERFATRILRLPDDHPISDAIEEGNHDVESLG